MAQTLSVTEAARHFAEYINRVLYRGESFILVRGNKPIAELRPLPTGRQLAELPALLSRCLISLPPTRHTWPMTSRQRGRRSPGRRSAIRGRLDRCQYPDRARTRPS